MRRVRIPALIAFALSLSAGRAADSPYWSYHYDDIEVIAAGSSEYAVHLAHNLKRFDQALVQVLQLESPKRLPVRLYALTREDFNRLLGKNAAYAVRPYPDVTLILTSSGWGPGGGGYQGAYFGYAAGLIRSNGAERYPLWYQLGVPLVFSDVTFVGDQLSMGGVLDGPSYTLAHGVWLPVRTVLQAQAHDPLVRSAMFQSESWYLAREVFIEGKYREEFLHYLTLISQGQKEADAYQASFKVPYEAFDKMLVVARREGWHHYVMHVADEPGSESLVRLSEEAAQARLALLEPLLRPRPRGN